MRAIGVEERRARLGLRHHLARPASTVETAVVELVGLHSSDPSTVFLSAWARVEGFVPSQLEGTLYEQRTLVRMLGMRRTLFVVPADLASAMNEACTKAFVPAQRTRLIRMLEDQVPSTDPQAWLDDVSQRTLAALAAREQSSARELTAEVPELATKLSFGEGTTWGGTVGVSTRVLFLLATEGAIVRARPLGGWTSGQYRWALTDRWLGGELSHVPHAEACAELLRRWLRASGPATLADVRWWSGWTARSASAALATIGAVEVDLGDGIGYVLPDDLEPVGEPDPWAALLPSLDVTVMSWKERDWYLGEHAGALFDRNGNAGATVWADGRVVGGWGQAADGDVRTELLEPVGAETAAAIERERERLTRWLGGMRVRPRFGHHWSERSRDSRVVGGSYAGGMTCAVCGRRLPDDARFCPGCGAAVTSSLGTEERKIVTVLFADLVDSTGLAQRIDAERARAVLGRFYDAATQELLNLRGRPEKFIGDAVMAVFGLQQVHEDDALRAVRAGIAIRARAGRLSEELSLPDELEVRVGIEAGEAATGTGPSEQLLVTGSVVNAAARLQTAAEPGEVLVGATAHALTASAVSFGDRREVQAKGFEGLLRAYPVLGLTTRSVRRTIPFVGRDEELTTLREAFHRVVASRAPSLVTITGEPGAGKSRLADELVAGLELGVAVMHGHAQVAAGSASFAPVAAIVRQLAGIGENDPPDVAATRLRALVEGRFDATESERAVDELGLSLGLTETRLEESTFVQDVQGGFLRLIDAVSASTPVVLMFEDVHELSSPMLDLIERVASRRRRGSVLVLALARPRLRELRPAWGTDTDHSVLELRPLSRDQSVELVRQAGGLRIGEHEADAIAERAGGNPFFIVETTGMLLDEGAPAGAVPPTVQAVIAARIDALPDPTRDLARRTSVFFVSFDLEEVRALLGDGAGSRGESDDPLVARLGELEEAELIVRTDDPSPRWRFRHATLRDVAYASLPKRQRSELHVAVADRLIADDHRSWAADHLEEAALAQIDIDPTSRELPDRAADALAEAGDRARRRMENRSATDRYRRALAMADAADWGVREARVLAGMGEAFYWLGEYPGATEVLEQAVDLGTRLGDDRTLALALRFLGDIAINVGADLDRAEVLLDRSLEAAERLDDPHAIARTLLFAGWVPWTRDRLDEAESIWRRALELSERHDDRWARIRSLCSLSIVIGDLDRIDEATTMIERARELAIEVGDQFSLAVATVQEGRLLEEGSDHEKSLPYFDRGIEIFSELGARWELGDALAARGIAEREIGRLDDAERDLQRAVEISEELGERQLAGWTWRALSHVSERRGDHAKAEEHRRRAEQAEFRRPR